MGYSRLSLISGLLEMIARTAVGIWGVPQFGFAAACLASPLAWALADCFLIPAYYGCLNARRRQAARVRRELPSEGGQEARLSVMDSRDLLHSAQIHALPLASQADPW